MNDFTDNRATKKVYKGGRFGSGRGEMAEGNTEKTPAGKPAIKGETRPAKLRRPLAGFLVAGASLALLFGIAALKGRVTDDNTDSERGLE